MKDISKSAKLKFQFLHIPGLGLVFRSLYSMPVIPVEVSSV